MDIKTFLFGGVYNNMRIEGFNTFTEYADSIENFNDFKQVVGNLTQDFGWNDVENVTTKSSESTNKFGFISNEELQELYKEFLNAQ